MSHTAETSANVGFWSLTMNGLSLTLLSIKSKLAFAFNSACLISSACCSLLISNFLTPMKYLKKTVRLDPNLNHVWLQSRNSLILARSCRLPGYRKEAGLPFFPYSDSQRYLIMECDSLRVKLLPPSSSVSRIAGTYLTGLIYLNSSVWWSFFVNLISLNCINLELSSCYLAAPGLAPNNIWQTVRTFREGGLAQS